MRKRRTTKQIKKATPEERNRRHTCIICGEKRYSVYMVRFVCGHTHHYYCIEFSKGCMRKCYEVFPIINQFNDEQLKLLKKLLN